MTEEEYNLEMQVQQREHQQRVEQHLQAIEKLLKSTNTTITVFIVFYLCSVLVFLIAITL